MKGDAREGNFILNIFFLASKAKASTVLGKGEECVLCDPGYELRKGGSLTKPCAENTRGWGRKKTQETMNVFPALFGACYVLIDWVLYQPIIHNNINTRHLEV